MRIYLTPKKGSRRFAAGAAVAVSALAIMLGLVPAVSASTVAPARPGRRGRARLKQMLLGTDAGPVLGHRPSE